MNDNFVLCVNNKDYPASLEILKVYRVIPDPTSEEMNFIRIIDESGEDYLFPKDYFTPIKIPFAAREILSKELHFA